MKKGETDVEEMKNERELNNDEIDQALRDAIGGRRWQLGREIVGARLCTMPAWNEAGFGTPFGMESVGRLDLVDEL